MLRIAAPAQDVDALVDELRDRVGEELDYRLEAANQRLFAAYYDGHPFIRVPAVVDELSTRRVLTTELADGARFAELAAWPQDERDLAAETIYRFVFRSLYRLHAFNGDPHPGNYLFQRGGRVTFLDFGLVKHFTAAELRPLVADGPHLCVEQRPRGVPRAAMEDAGFLRPGAPLSTEDDRRPPGRLLRHRPRARTADHHQRLRLRRRAPVLRPAQPGRRLHRRPAAFVILQRINLGLFAVLGELSATADWRGIAEEIWPFVHGPAAPRWARPRPRGAHAATRPRHDGPGHPGRAGLLRQTVLLAMLVVEAKPRRRPGMAAARAAGH